MNQQMEENKLEINNDQITQDLTSLTLDDECVKPEQSNSSIMDSLQEDQQISENVVKVNNDKIAKELTSLEDLEQGNCASSLVDYLQEDQKMTENVVVVNNDEIVKELTSFEDLVPEQCTCATIADYLQTEFEMSEDQQTEPIRSEESNDNIGEQPSTSNDNRTETDDSVFTTMINYLQSRVEMLYKFGKSVPRNCAVEAPRDYEYLMDTINKTLVLIKRNEEAAIAENEAQYYFLVGKTMSVSIQLSDECVAVLIKSIKLDPTNLEAWDLLGECLVRLKKLREAAFCYYKSLQFGRNKQILRKFSIILRVTTQKATENVKYRLNLCIKYANESVKMDTTDGQSWAVLGSAYLSLFCVEQQVITINKSMKAFENAYKDLRCRKYADLHMNRGITFKYAHMYTEALVSFEAAMKADSKCVAPKNTFEDLIKYLTSAQTLFQRKGQIKLTKLKKMTQSLDTSSLGLYNKPIKTLTGQLILNVIPLSKLQTGLNINKVICGRVVCVVYHEEPAPYTFCLVDKELNCIVVSVYNLTSSKGPKIGDSVAIPEPFLIQIDAKYNDQRFQYPLINVTLPLTLVVNKKCLEKECVSARLGQ